MSVRLDTGGFGFPDSEDCGAAGFHAVMAHGRGAASIMPDTVLLTGAGWRGWPYPRRVPLRDDGWCRSKPCSQCSQRHVCASGPVGLNVGGGVRFSQCEGQLEEVGRDCGLGLLPFAALPKG